MTKQRGRKPNNEGHELKVLSKYLEGRCHSRFAETIRISKAHLSMILAGTRKPSIFIANRIILETEGKVSLKDLLPELHDAIINQSKEIEL